MLSTILGLIHINIDPIWIDLGSIKVRFEKVLTLVWIDLKHV